MFKRPRRPEPFGKAGLTVAVCALVMALVGGAYAAGGLTKAQEKQVTKIAKKYAGKPGAAGTNGTAGAAGKEGPEGLPGKNGTNGTNGREGSPWTAGGTLPSKQTETGAWAFGPVPAGSGGEEAYASVGFAIPLNAPLDEQHVHDINADNAGTVSACPGSPKEPKAEPGNLCIYQSEQSNVTNEFKILRAGEPKVHFEPTIGLNLGASTSGSLLLFEILANTSGSAYGTWAVTAP